MGFHHQTTPPMVWESLPHIGQATWSVQVVHLPPSQQKPRRPCTGCSWLWSGHSPDGRNGRLDRYLLLFHLKWSEDCSWLVPDLYMYIYVDKYIYKDCIYISVWINMVDGDRPTFCQYVSSDWNHISICPKLFWGYHRSKIDPKMYIVLWCFM